jgi:hypothetical protein
MWLSALAMLHELYWKVLLPLPTASCGTAVPVFTFKPAMMAPHHTLTVTGSAILGATSGRLHAFA